MREKRGAAQAIAGKCSQEERKNGEATVNEQQRKAIGWQGQKKKMERCTNHVRVQQNFII